MDTVEMCLAGTDGVDIVRIHPSVPDVASRLQSLHPHLILVDLNSPNLGFLAAVLQEQPTVPIVCIDAPCSKIMVLTGCQYTIATVDDLLAIVEHLIHSDPAGCSAALQPAALRGTQLSKN